MGEYFLHGVEVLELDDGSRPIQTVKSSVIGLIGTAPKGPVNQPTLILGSKTEAVKIFGESSPGFTIPDALSGIFDQTGAVVVVINVADPANSKLVSTVDSQEYTFDENNEITVGKYSISNVSVKGKDETAYIENTDYNVNKEDGIITRLTSGNIPENQPVQVSYTRLDPSKITAGEIIGGVTADGRYTGVQCFLASMNEVSVQPRLLAAPGFTHDRPESGGEKLANPVVAELISVAERLRAIVIADCPNGTKEEAVSYRKDWGAARLYCVYPWAKVYDSATGNTIEEPLSARIAGLIAKTDNDKGFWWSPSNNIINGIIGISKPIDFTLGDPNCVANYLNENLITTVIQQDGFRLWGNRTTSADSKWAFLSVRRTADMINDSLLKAHLWAIDRNITKTYVSDVCDGVSNYLRYLKNIGAIINGSCWADSSLNTPDQISQGKIVFDFDFTPPYPAEHITFRSRLTDEYLTEIFE